MLGRLWAIATDAGLSFGETETYKTVGILKIGGVVDVWFAADLNRAVAVTKNGSVICTSRISEEPPEKENSNIYNSIKFTVLHGDVSYEE